MEEGILDLSKIPRLQFEVNNDELKNCIRELHFQSKTQEKNMQKMKKDMEMRPLQTAVADSLALINSNIEIDPILLKQIAVRNELKSDDSVLKSASYKLGLKIAQVSDVLKVLFEKMKQLQKRIDTSEGDVKLNIGDKFANLQSQIDQFKKSQYKENRNLGETMQLTINKYEEKLSEVQSKTLWQINDCKTKLGDRVNQQFVRDVVREAEARITTKVKQSLVKKNIDPQRIDKLESRCLKLQKQMEIKAVEVSSKLNELRSNIEHTLATKVEVNQDKFQTEKKIGNIQVQVADINRRIKNNQLEIVGLKEDFTQSSTSLQETGKEVVKLTKLVANLKISDDFQKLMENLDPHKICQIDTTLAGLAERDLKIQRELDAMKRYQQKLKEKVEICNMLAPNQKGKLDKEEINKIFMDLITVNPTFKKIQTIEGQLHEFRAYGDMISEINKRIGKIQKEFDLQSIIYGLKGLEQYIKKELLIMNTKLNQLQSALAEQKRRRPLSARKTTDGKLSSSVSFKKLTPVDCISCFQNPMTTYPEQKKLFASKY